MPALRRGKLEPFAEALALGLTPREASTQADCKRHRLCKARSQRPDVIARVAEVRQEAVQAAGDLMPIIEMLMAGAVNSGALCSAAGYVAMRALLADAAQLKILTAAKASQIATPRLFAKPLTTEEWLAKFGPQTVVEP